MPFNIQKVFGKTLMRSLVATIPASLFMAVIGFILITLQTVLAPIGTIIATLVSTIAAVYIFLMAVKYHKGKEDIITMLPTIALVAGFTTVLSLIPVLSVIAASFEVTTISGLLVGVSSIYLAVQLTKGWVK